MPTQQPEWKLVANLGDVNPIDYGGFFVFIDTTGVYGPEAEVYEPNDETEDGGTVYRFMLETGLNEWWRKSIPDVADGCGGSYLDYEADLSSEDPIRIGRVYQDLFNYHGSANFDFYPIELTQAEAEERYSQPKYKAA